MFVLEDAELKYLYQIGMVEDEASLSVENLPKHLIIGKTGTIYYLGPKLSVLQL